MTFRSALILMVGLVMGSVAHGADTPFKEGLQYVPITPAPAHHQGDKVEVIEFFWYGCPHCNSLEPYIEKWRQTKADYIDFQPMPATFAGRAMLHAKTYYALQVLGEAERLHPLIFEAMHAKHMKLDTVEAMTAFLETQGVDGKAFREALDSFAVQTQVNRAAVLAKRYGITGVPTLVIDGRYKSGKGFTSYGEFTELVDYLAAKIVKDRQGAESH